MKHILHKSGSRGQADHGWLKSKHSFSFANYYNPERMGFGVLRVLNDDEVAPAMGFGTHPHRDMEIISIPLEGDLEHKDSMGHSTVISEGEIQVMSAGTGVAHSEYNKNKDKAVKFLQIWVLPREKQVSPRYDQLELLPEARQNRFQQILSPSADDEGVWIHQDAWFSLASIEAGKTLDYQLHDPENNGVYAFLIEGEVVINGQSIGKRDALGIWDTARLEVKSAAPSELLLMEVPMQ